MRRALPWKTAVLAGFLSIQALAQIEARTATPEDAKVSQVQQEIASPMLLDLPLAGDDKKAHFVDLPKQTSRLIRDTRDFISRGVTIDSVTLLHRKGKKKRTEVVVMPILRTINRRDKVNLQVQLLAGDTLVKNWEDEFIVGVKVTEGLVGVVAPNRTESREAVFTFPSEDAFQESLGGDDAKLRLILEVRE
ncbi:MAG: hypothetical protein AAF604_08070 [Acidobacteriota bacterium]